MRRLMGGRLSLQANQPIVGPRYVAPTTMGIVGMGCIAKTAFGPRLGILKITLDIFENGWTGVFTPMMVSKMLKFDFILRFKLPLADGDPEVYLDDLYEAGCDDATVGIGLPGCVALNFCREASSAAQAIQSAIADVLTAIPEAELIEIGPDLMNITDIAELLSERGSPITRQAMRKYAFNQVAKVRSPFPPAAITSNTPLWHLRDALDWMVSNEKIDSLAANPLIQTAQATFVLNIIVKNNAVKTFTKNIEELLTISRETERLLSNQNNRGKIISH